MNRSTENQAHCYSPMNTIKRTVAASSLISNTQGQVLINEHPSRGWEVPGGKIEAGETITQGLEREIFEETGTIVDVGPMTGVYSNLSLGIVIFTFLSDYKSGELTTCEESLQVEWSRRDTCLDQVTHPAIRARIADMLNFDGRPRYRAYTIDPYIVLQEAYLNE